MSHIFLWHQSSSNIKNQTQHSPNRQGKLSSLEINKEMKNVIPSFNLLFPTKVLDFSSVNLNAVFYAIYIVCQSNLSPHFFSPHSNHHVCCHLCCLVYLSIANEFILCTKPPNEHIPYQNHQQSPQHARCASYPSPSHR